MIPPVEDLPTINYLIISGDQWRAVQRDNNYMDDHGRLLPLVAHELYPKSDIYELTLCTNR